MAESPVDFDEKSARHLPHPDELPTTRPARPDENAPAQAELHRWSARRIAIAALLWVIGAVLLGVLSFFAHQYPEFPGDVGLAVWIQHLHQPVLVHLVNGASDVNWPLPGGIIAGSVIFLLLLVRQVRAALSAALGAFGADGLNVELNALVARPRPNNSQIHAVAHLGLHSFPSGHVTHVLAFYGFLLYFSLVFLRAHPRWRPWLVLPQALCVYFILFVGPSRVLEGEHWPSDVVGGYLLGALVLLLAIALFHVLELGRRRMAAWRWARAIH